MAKYTQNRKYSKKPTGTKKVIKKITKKEVVTPVAPVPAPAKKKSLWQKVKDWVKGIAG